MLIVFDILLLILCIIFPPLNADSDTTKCSSLRVRRNANSLSKQEWADYIDAFSKAYKTGIIDTMTRIHLADFQATHHQPLFLLYHRVFAWYFENRLREFNPSLTIPYWDETEDADYPHKSFLFGADYFGATGHEEDDFCLMESFLKNVTLAFPICHACKGCLRRQFNGPKPGTIKPFTNRQVINDYLANSPTFDEFRFWIEDSLHYQVHDGIGGRNGDMSAPTSSNDPFFYFHHSNMDRLHVQWAKLHPEAAQFVNGMQEIFDSSQQAFDRIKYTNDVPIPYFNMTSGSVLNIDRPPLCYTYDKI